MHVRKYRLDPSAFLPTTKRRLVRRLGWQIPLTVVVLFAFLVLSFRAQGLALSPWYFAMALVVAVGLLLAPLRGSLMCARNAWETLELIVSDNVLRLHLGSVPPIEIMRPEVTRVVETKDRDLLVYSRDPGRQVFIPAQLKGFDEVRMHLRKWREFERASPVRDHLLGALWAATLVGSACAAAAPDIHVAAGAGVVLIVTAALLLKRVFRLKALDNRVKAKQLVVLGLFAVVPVYRVIFYVLFRS